MGDKKAKYEKLGDVPATVWQALSRKKIYFGHQSVGYNILQGLEQVLKENPQIDISIKETYDPDDFEAGTIAQSQIGYNGNPESKLDKFAFLAKVAGSGRADIMFFKFCYLDFDEQTETKALFERYGETFEKLRSAYPQTTFIHMTVPLTSIQGGIKGKIKKILGRLVGGAVENMKRCDFNDMLRAAYADTAPLLDIAALESTFPDGSRASFKANGKTYYYLVPDYTTDGGHLNGLASKLVAEQLLLTMAESI